MNVLFQRFLESYLRRKLNGFRVRGERRQAFDIENQISMRPDIVVDFKDQHILVIDAKYKEFHVEADKGSGISSDIAQVHTYAVILKVPYCVLVYPRQPSLPTSKSLHAHGGITVVLAPIELAGTREN